MSQNLLPLLAFTLAVTSAWAAEPALLGRTAAEWSRELGSDDELRRAKGAWALAQFGTAEFDRINLACQHGDAAVRTWAVRGLGVALKDEKDESARGIIGFDVLQRALDDDSPAVQIAAAEALLQRQKGKAVARLTKLLDHPSDPIRHHALLALDKPFELDPALRDKIAQMRDDPYDYAKRVAVAITERHRKEQQR